MNYDFIVVCYRSLENKKVKIFIKEVSILILFRWGIFFMDSILILNLLNAVEAYYLVLVQLENSLEV